MKRFTLPLAFLLATPVFAQHEHHPGMQAPPNMGRAYTTEFRQMFADLAAANGASLIPFLLEGVGGVVELNQSDGIHPTAEGHRMLAENVWQVLQPVLSSQQ